MILIWRLFWNCTRRDSKVERFNTPLLLLPWLMTTVLAEQDQLLWPSLQIIRKFLRISLNLMNSSNGTEIVSQYATVFWSSETAFSDTDLATSKLRSGQPTATQDAIQKKWRSFSPCLYVLPATVTRCWRDWHNTLLLRQIEQYIKYVFKEADYYGSTGIDTWWVQPVTTSPRQCPSIYFSLKYTST